MVVLNVKKGDEGLFLMETSTGRDVESVTLEIARLYNLRLRLDRLCSAVEQLAAHGLHLPENMVGLTDDQIEELKLVDEWAGKCVPCGGAVFNQDPIGRRSGNAPNQAMKDVLLKTVADAKSLLSKTQMDHRVCVTKEMVDEAFANIKGATMIVYPMGLPPHEEVRINLEDDEDLSGKQASKIVIEDSLAELWWAGKHLQREKILSDYIGKNEKTKIVVKIQKRGAGAPQREPVVTEAQQKEMMIYYHRKQEEAKKMAEQEDEDSYLNSPWADPNSLKQSLQGTAKIGFKMSG